MPVTVGIAGGTAAAFALARWAEGLLLDLSGFDPPTLGRRSVRVSCRCRGRRRNSHPGCRWVDPVLALRQ
jgi:hypothetical protein